MQRLELYEDLAAWSPLLSAPADYPEVDPWGRETFAARKAGS